MESFFLSGSCFDETELKELLLRRYHSLDFLKDMDINGFVKFAILAKEKDKEDRIYQQWCAMLPQLKEYMGFEEFKESITGKNIDMRPKEEIIAEIAEMHGIEVS